MATTTKANAKRSQSLSTTSTKAGVKSRKPKAPTKAQIEKAYAVAIAKAKVDGVKPPMQPRAEFMSAILRAYSVASLTEAGLGTSKGEAGARREHSRNAKAGSVTVDMVVFLDRVEALEGIGIVTDRPENTVRARLEGFCRVMGLPIDYFYAVRGEKWQEGEAGAPVYVLRK